MRLIALMLAILVSTSFSCDDDCEDAAFYVAGMWSSAFHCSSTGPDGCFTGTDMLTVMQPGDDTAPSREVTFSDNVGGQFSGTMCGTVFTWTGRGNQHRESGTWVFSSADRFTKVTSYADDDGSANGCCSGEGVRQGAMTPVPPTQCPANTCAPP